ncbi:helix-turn-helix domain-containing protein [Vibrio scophthalmi]|uniref:Maltose metabolism regulator n=1 Tax=Vibrio scophthalmi LMG 19158 TaxID=870967 RepID=F9RRK1_9VIBR|nr:helix-turn-helix transcriptional regulator [Vibrio scophthalmi]EGU33017.1 maltose metabolism regulator [Vibrio scophthalmi LMG 19158]
MKEKETIASDWHQADIKAELEKKGLNMTELSRTAGLAEGTLRNVFRVRYPKAQKIIAGALGVSPETIWPSRY